VINLRRVGTGVWVSAAVLAVFAADRFLGTHWPTSLAIAAVACGALHEFYGLLESAGIACHRAWGTCVLGAALFLRAAGPDLRLLRYEAREISLAVLALGFLGPFLLAVARADREVEPDPAPARRAAATALGLGWVGLLASFLLELRMLGSGPGAFRTGFELTLVLIASVKVGDSVAYFVGRSVGRTPLSPISPKKTWEGSVGSIVGSVATSVLVGGVLFDQRLSVMAGFGVVTDLAGQGGDLVESYVKRLLGAKDSSSRFGEMGGFLDIVDALLLAAPAALLFAAILVERG
jgi:phosphatidate cytidylyltransferase